MKKPNASLSILLVSLIALSSLIAIPNLPRAHAPATTTLAAYSWDYGGSVIVDPTLAPGSVFMLDLYATNIPPVIDQLNGGINAYDITVSYNSSILKATDESVDPPICAAVNDICLFAQSVRTGGIIEASRQVNNPLGVTRLAEALLASSTPPNYNRASGTGSLFAIKFQVVGRGFTNVTIDTGSSYIIEDVANSGANLPYTAVDLSFENRLPYNIGASPSAAGLVHGESVVTNVTAVQVWTIQSFTEGLHFAISGLPAGATATFNPVNSTGALPFSTRLNVTTSTSIPNGVYSLNITATSSITNIVRSTVYRLTVGSIDVAVTSVSPAPTVVAIGDAVSVAVGVANPGVHAQTVTVNLFANLTQVGTQSILLLSGATQTVNFSWNTTGFSIGPYLITAKIPPVTGETIVSNNNMTVGPVTLAAGFRVSTNITSGVIRPGAPISVQVTVANVTSAREQVSLSITGMPSGITNSFTPQFGLPLFTSVISLNDISNAPRRAFQLQIVGTSSSGLVRTALFTLVVDPDFTVSPNPTSGTVGQTQSLTVLVTLANVTGSQEQVLLSTTGLPSGVVSSFSLVSGLPRFTSNLHLNASAAAAVGTFTINVVGTSASGIVRQASFTLTVNYGHDVKVTTIVPSSTVVNPGQTLTFTVGVVNNGLFKENLTMNVYVKSSSGSSLLVGTATATNLSPSGAQSLTVTWNTAGYATGTYTFNATILPVPQETHIVDNSLSGSGSVRINSPPTSAFTPNTTTPQTGQTITFDASGSTDSDGAIATYTWDFGDGTPTATGKTVSHQYTSAQTFTVKLTVADNDGATTTVSQTVTVTQAPTGTSFLTSVPFLAGIATAILGVIGALLYIRSRKPSAPGQPPPSTTGATPLG